MANAVALSHPKGPALSVFPDASDNHWGSFFTQVPTAGLEGGVEVEKLPMSHVPAAAVRTVAAFASSVPEMDPFAFKEVLQYYALNYWCLLHCQVRWIFFLVETDLWGCCRV